ncbi:F0F1 ATP synthase subunit B [Glacieibacterium sp.]|uniref:F0F1 ATP synthase subunit B family protein n=1 Tax=Glacieibacterium sp. TaxID=2860237 RepID=UPI003AFFB729
MIEAQTADAAGDNAQHVRGAHDNAPVLQTDPPGSPANGVAATNTEVGKVEHASEEGPFYRDPEFWVAIGFLLFVAILIYLKVQKSAASALDARGARIKHDLDDAARLRSEAETLLAQAEARLAASAGDAQAIVEQALRNAREVAEQGARDLDALIVRRTKAAEERIVAAQRAAEAELRARAVDLATEQARAAIAAQSDPAMQNRLTNAAISELDRRLN